MLASARFKLIYAFFFLGGTLACLWPAKLVAQVTPQPVEQASLIPDPLKRLGVLPSQSRPTTIPLTDASDQIDISPLTSFWIDESAETTLDELLARATSGASLFKPTPQREILPIHGKVLWIRFETQTETRQARWLLEIGSPVVDDVQLFWRDALGRWQVQKAGDTIPRSQWPVQARMPSFYLAQQAGEPVEYFLRVVHQRVPVSLQIKVWQDRAFLASQQNHMLAFGLLFGLVLLVLMMSAATAIVMRDGAFLAYGGYLITLGGFMLTNVGLSAQYLWPNSPLLADRMVFVLACLTAATGPWFVRMVVQPTVAQRSIDLAIRTLAGAMVLMALVEAFAPTVTSYFIVNIATVFSLVLVYTLVYSAWQRGDASTRWVAVGFIPVVLGVAPILARNLGLIPSGFFTQYGMLVGAAIEMPILIYTLLARATRRRDNFMRSVGLPSQDALTRLPNLRAFLDQLHGVITRASRYRHRYGLVLVEFTNEAWFAKEHTREVADRALILLASRLQRLSREVDLVGRIDATYFAMVLEGPCDQRMMANWTARIAAYGHKPNEVLPVGATLKLKITCALMPLAASAEAGDDANAQLGWLIAQADAIAPDPRKTVHTLGF